MEKSTEESHSSKMAVLQVLAGLINDPLLFSDGKHKFSLDDFPEQFHKILFGAVEHLATNGMAKISYIDIDQFLRPYPVQYKVFVDNKGSEYVNRALQIYDERKFEYYYNTLKKHSLLNSLAKQGFDTRDIYDPDIIDPLKNAAMREKFDNMSVNDILEWEEGKIVSAKETYGSNGNVVENLAGDQAEELFESLKESPEMGLPMVSPKLTTMFRGQRLGCLMLQSAPSGGGKSRWAAAEACNLAVEEYYDLVKQEWIKTGFHESVLLISTELEKSEIQTMFWAYVSGVSEAHILDARYLPGEEERVRKAIQLISHARLWIVSVTNFDSEDIVTIIRKYHQLYHVNYIYYDYLGETLKMMAEGASRTKVSGLRTDQILLQMSSDLKDVAKQLGVFIWTASQLSGNYKEAREVDQTYLRSAKSLSDKIDVGSIMLPVRESDQPIIDAYTQKGFEIVPNFVINIYKIRRGSYQNVRLFGNFDRGTCRWTDCFCCDNKGVILPIEDTKIDMILDMTSEESFDDAMGVKEKAEDKPKGDGSFKFSF